MSSKRKHIKELDWTSKVIRKFLISFAPQAPGAVSTNDLFNTGYGGFVTCAVQFCFFFTFVFYSVLNTQENLSRNYLSPLNGGDKGQCADVPVVITNYFISDYYGNWESSEDYLFSGAVYDLDYLNVRFENGDSDYRKQIMAFKEDLRVYTERGLSRDFAWNAIFAVAYSGFNYDYGGAAKFFIDSEARIMFDEFVWSGGFSHAGGVCNPGYADYYFDGGSFVMEVGGIDTTTEWDPCPSFLDPVHDLDFHPEWGLSSHLFTVDSATLTMAYAVNIGITPLEFETPVASFIPTNGFSAYTDFYYAPMQPFQCINANLIARNADLTWPYARDVLCLMFIGNMVALPVATSSGTYDDTCFIAKQCKCSDPRSEPGTGCNRMDITSAFIFVPYSVHQGNMTEAVLPLIQIMIRAFELNPSDPDIGLTDLTFPAMNSAYNANDWDRRGIYDQPMSSVYPNYDADTCPITVAAGLNMTFNELCDGKCAILQFSQEASKANSYGARLNAGGYSNNNLSCATEFYRPELLDHLANNPPTDTIQLYQVCHSSLSMAFTDGISNAFASAGLYSSILLVIVITLVMNFHNWMFPYNKLKSPEETEVAMRNTIVEVFDKLIESVETGNTLSESEAKNIRHKLHKHVQICDPVQEIQYFSSVRDVVPVNDNDEIVKMDTDVKATSFVREATFTTNEDCESAYSSPKISKQQRHSYIDDDNTSKSISNNVQMQQLLALINSLTDEQKTILSSALQTSSTTPPTSTTRMDDQIYGFED